MATDSRSRTAAARAEQLRRAAIRASHDPVTLARAARIIRAALERQALAEQDLRGPIVAPSDLQSRRTVA